MITAPKSSAAGLLSAWSAGIALFCLGIGLNGATGSLLPQGVVSAHQAVGSDTVAVEMFQPPEASAAPDETPPEPETKEEDIEIPPLPEITPPLTPPEMVEITPIEQIRETPPPKSVEHKPEPPKPTPPPVAKRKAPPSSTSSTTGTGSTGGSSGAPVLFQGGGGGRFPSPTYPASARATKQQGTVRLLVTVEASGIPSSVEVTASSGAASLDSAARDTISRRWRWPAGAVRKFIIPIRFVIQ